MGIELPPELADVAAQAGVEWPEADEDAMAKQAQAWRDTATSMSTLSTDADTTARSALQTVSGETATKASTEWKTFVDPDNGHLTSVVRDANAAADRLEHAANQVGTAKVEIVRNLVGLAQNQDAANAAAQAGHPTALAGLDTAVRGTAANVAHIQTQLVSAVQPASGVDMATVQNPVNANPGHHLLPGVTTTATDVVTHAVTDVGQTATTVTTNTTQAVPGAGNLAQPSSGNLLHHVTGAADQTVSGVTGVTQHVTGDASDLVRHAGDAVGGTADQLAPGAGEIPRHGTSGAADLVQHGGNTIGQVPGDIANTGPGGALPAPGHPGDLPPNLPGTTLPADPEVTGPVPHTNFPADVPTPATGQTVQAGFAGGLEPSAAPAPTNLPPAAATAAPPLNPAAPAFGGTPGFAGAPAVPVPPVAGGAPAVGAPAVGGPSPAPAAQPARPATYAAVPGAGADRGQEPAPRKQMAGPPGAPPPAKGERNEALAAFWIHMFPIGHLPVASYRPARQLPPPPPELDYAAGLRFEPGDHPQFHLVDTAPRLAEIKTAIAREAAAKAAVEAQPPYQRFAPTPAPGYPLPPPAHPAEAVAAGYPPPGSPAETPPTYAPADAGHPGVVSPAAGYPPAVAPPASGHSPAVGFPPAAAPPAPAPLASGPPAAGPAEHPAASNPSTGHPPASAGAHQAPPGSDPATVPSMRPVTPSAGLTADHPTVENLLENHDPLGGGHERDWDRRYLVRLGSVTAHGISPEGLEYNWPTSEQYPEGGSASGEPEVLAEGTVIDRFGTPHGRVFAADGTPFAQRSLPPPHKDTGFRRYRIVKPLPVWRAVSAAWFGQPGGGVRYRTTHSAVELVALGHLEEIA